MRKVLVSLITLAAGLLGMGVYNLPHEGGQGWQQDNAAVHAFTETLKFKSYNETPAFAAVRGDSGDVFLWDACKAVTGDILPPKNQGSVGSCVGFGTASAAEHLLCVQIVEELKAARPPPAFKAISPEAIYGGSRYQVGFKVHGSSLHRNGDGSVGAWAAEWVNTFGLVPVDAVGEYDETRCRQYGREGCPTELEAIARRSPVRDVVPVHTWDEILAAMHNGHPMTICSNTGFASQRDADGFARASGQWAHCMAVVGVQNGRRPGVFILNSWGTSYHRGPSGAGNPSPAGFWCDKQTFLRMVYQGECWAFGDSVGFPAKKVKWFT